MVTRYRKESALYSFYLWDNETATGYKNYITIVRTPDDATQPETIRNIPVNECDGYRIKINKKSITAADGARGLFSFIRDCIRNDFMLAYVDRICRQFAPDPTI